MKLPIITLATVLCGSLLTGAVAASAPAGAASNPAITIRAIDREGALVPVTASLQSLDGSVDITLTSGAPAQVPEGTYNLAAWVKEPGSVIGAQTLVDREISITKAVTVTFDARQGRQVQFTVNDPTVAMNRMTVEPFMPGKNVYALPTANYNTTADYTYMVPGKLPPGWEVLVEAEMIAPPSGPSAASPVDYIFVRQLKGSIPSDLTFASDKAKLATDTVTVRQVTDSVPPRSPLRTATATLMPISYGQTLPTTAYGQDGTAPYTLKFLVTPGYRYVRCAGYGDGGCDSTGLTAPLLRAGDHLAQTFGNAVFGPSPWLGPIVTGKQMTDGNYQASFLLVDPTQYMVSFGLATATQQAWFYEGSKVLAHSANATVSVARIAPATHWYRLVIEASRGPDAELFKSLKLSYSFQAHANSGGSDFLNSFWPRIIPSGLSARNSAPGATKTTVPMWFVGMAGNNPVTIAAHNVSVCASVDGGKTWTALRVSHTGNRWTFVVSNPGKPGYVSLRVRATNAAGSTADVTIINAYAVS